MAFLLSPNPRGQLSPIVFPCTQLQQSRRLKEAWRLWRPGGQTLFFSSLEVVREESGDADHHEHVLRRPARVRAAERAGAQARLRQHAKVTPGGDPDARAKPQLPGFKRLARGRPRGARLADVKPSNARGDVDIEACA